MDDLKICCGTNKNGSACNHKGTHKRDGRWYCHMHWGHHVPQGIRTVSSRLTEIAKGKWAAKHGETDNSKYFDLKERAETA